MKHFGYRRESHGYSIWQLALYTGDPLELLDYARSWPEAQRKVNHLYEAAACDA